MVGLFSRLSIHDAEWIIVFGTAGKGGVKAISDLHTFDSADGHHGMGQTGVQLFKYWIADAGGNTSDPAAYRPANRIMIGHFLSEESFCLDGGIRIRHIKPVIHTRT